MARRDNVPLRAHLKSLIVDRVDYVGAGANGESDILLWKSHHPTTTTSTPGSIPMTITKADKPALTDAEKKKAAEDAAAMEANMKKAVDDAVTAAVAKFSADLEALATPPAPVDPLADLPPEVAKAMKDRDDEVTKAKAETDQLRKAVSELQEAEADRVFKAKAADLPRIGAVDSVAAVLKSVAAGDPGAYAKVEELLKTADERLKESGLLKASGTAGEGWLEGASDDPADQLDAAAKALRDADPKLTVADSISKAVAAQPELYRAMSKRFTAAGVTGD